MKKDERAQHCGHEGCKEWATHGFGFGAVWRCGAHAKEYSAAQNSPLPAMNEVQGRLL